MDDIITTTKSIIQHHHEVATGIYVIQGHDEKLSEILLGILCNLEELAEKTLDLLELDEAAAAEILPAIQQRFAECVGLYEHCKTVDAALIDPDVLADWADEGKL